MTTSNEPLAWIRESGIRNYLFVCVTALAVIFFALVRIYRVDVRYFDPRTVMQLITCFVPVFVGLAGALRGWRIGPLLTALLVVLPLFFQETRNMAEYQLPRTYPPGGYLQPRQFSLADWVLCGGLLAYMAAHYRLQGLTTSILPRERVRRIPSASALTGGISERSPAPIVKRAGRLISPVEVSWLVLSLPIWAFLAQVIWVRLPTEVRAFELHPKTWQGIILCWVTVVILLIVAAVLRQLRLRRLGREEALLVMQDTLWTETRSEQRRLQSWLAWRQLGRQRRKEQS
jgi:hypothetical protein